MSERKAHTTASDTPALWQRWLPLIVFLVLWEAAARYMEHGVFFYGTPLRIASKMVTKIADGSLIIDSGVTLFEIVMGFIIGNTVGSILGLAFWYNPKIAAIGRPYIILFGTVPILALAPIIVIWFGIGIWAKIIIVALSTVVVATVQAFEGASQTESQYIEMLQSFGASRFVVFRKVVVPSSLIWLFAAYKLNVGFAVLGAFIGEFISARVGLGHLIIRSMGLFDTSMILTGVVMLCLLSYAIIAFIGLFQRRLMPWHAHRS